jgi:hypothetical protein
MYIDMVSRTRRKCAFTFTPPLLHIQKERSRSANKMTIPDEVDVIVCGGGAAGWFDFSLALMDIDL